MQVRLANHQRMLASPLHDSHLLEDAALTSSCEAILMDKPAADTVRFEAPVRCSWYGVRRCLGGVIWAGVGGWQ